MNKPTKEEIFDLFEKYQSDKIIAAEVLAMRLIKKYPQHGFSWKVLGGIYRIQNKKLDELNANKKSVELYNDDAESYNNLGITLQELNRLDEAEINLRKAIAVKSEYPEAYNNLGNTLLKKGKVEDAKKSFLNAIKLKSNYLEALNNLGITLLKLGQLDEAIFILKKTVHLSCKYPEANNNLGNALRKKGMFEESKYYLLKAIEFRPNYSSAFNNLGLLYMQTGLIKDAEKYFIKAVFKDKKNAEAFNNLGIILQETGKLKDAINNLICSINIDPEFYEAWNNIYPPIKAIQYTDTNYKLNYSKMFHKTMKEAYKIQLYILQYKLNVGLENSNYYLKKIKKALSNKKNRIVRNKNIISKKYDNKEPLPKKLVVLLHFGRSGTGLLHSLIDNHTEISTIPSIYFSEFFDGITWDKIVNNGWEKIVDNFINEIPVFFDSRVSNPVLSGSQLKTEYLGREEGMTALGNNKNEYISVNKDLFRKTLLRLILPYKYIDQLTFFKLIHLAYEKVINNIKHKKIIFYHIHNPDIYAKLNFLNHAPDAKWLIMIRNPIDSCESWIFSDFFEGKYEKIAKKIVSMLFDIDRIELRNKKVVGLRLEDLKLHPKKTMKKLCKWMNINDEENLYNMTAQGKKWWGDRTSFNTKAFGEMPKKKKNIFSENDKFILNTLFYPFSVSFGYVPENLEKFKKHLKSILPMFDNLFDFEVQLSRKLKIYPNEFKKSTSYLYLRSKMLDRYKVLIKHFTYPDMIKPL